MSATSDVVNEAIFMMGDNQPPVTGAAPTFDNSPAGIAASFLYIPCVQAVARQHEYDFARKSATLSVSGNPAPYPMGFPIEYIYPANGIQVWQITPMVPVDLNNPLPTNWVVGNTVVAGVQTKVIWTDVVAAVALFNNAPGPTVWDPSFREAVVRLLASEMAMAIAGRPDTAMFYAQSGQAAAAIAAARGEN